MSITFIIALIVLVYALLFMGLFSEKMFAYFYLLCLFLTEFIWLEVADAYIKPFHILSLFALFIFLFKKTPVFRAKTLFYLIAFFVVQAFYLLLISASFENFKTLSLLFIFITISINVAHILYKFFKNDSIFAKTLANTAFLIVIVGLIQVLFYRVGGKFITFRESQTVALYHELRYSSFFTEPDNCGKFLAVALLLILPYLQGYKKVLSTWVYIFLLLGLLLTMTRSAIIAYTGTLVAGIFLSAILFKKQVFVHIRVLLIFVGGIILLFFISQFLGSREVFAYRFGSLLRLRDTLQYDPSLPVRKLSVILALQEVISDPMSFLIGRGWGAGFLLTHGFYSDYVKGSANLYALLFLYSGLFGLLYFLGLIFRSVALLIKAVKLKVYSELALGTIYGFIASSIVGVLSHNFIAPEFWMLFGITIFIELKLAEVKNGKSLDAIQH